MDYETIAKYFAMEIGAIYDDSQGGILELSERSAVSFENKFYALISAINDADMGYTEDVTP